MTEADERLKNLETAVGGLLAKESSPTQERIRELIGQFRVVPSCAVDDDAAELLAKTFERRHGVTMTIGAMLYDQEYEPWLDAARVHIDPYYWERYRKLLQQKQYSGHVIASMDNVTDRILELLENPEKLGRWDRRGMVIGHVQSGKTANYTGLICKAADAGYRLIVVIAGVHNNLRNQTQARVDEGFVGRDSARLLANRDERAVGVGKIDQCRRPNTFTNSLKDFNKAMATGLGVSLQNLNEPAIFVIKKNSNTLKNLLEWIKEHSARSGTQTVDAPMLLIDDEADNASINIKHGKGEVARINGQIRTLLDMFERSCYVGYTATPFANIFIDPDTDDEMYGQDLFPRNFIVSLDPPSNYFGPSRVFLEDSEEVVRSIDDNEDLLPLKHRIDTQVVALPDSLMEAVRTFILARAIRLLRGNTGKHHSMLVNASRFTRVQQQLRNEIHNRLEDIQTSVRVNGALPPESAMRDPELAALAATWSREYSDTEFDWSVVFARLHEAVAPIRVVEVNSASSGSLNYAENEKTGLSVIAVGGFSLSRGLTLEGLTVSYFLRNSMMYDTLMQMGRWFGYRSEYEDLCRIWMPEEAEGWYAHIAESIEELREQVRQMEQAGATPKEFGLCVRSHPDSLIVTARNRMGSGELVRARIGLSNKFIETAALRRDESSLKENRAAVRSLRDALTAAGKPPSSAQSVSGGLLLRDVPVQPIRDFIAAFRNDPWSILTDPEPVVRYIDARAQGELAKWDVLFAGLLHPSGLVDDELLGVTINCQRRTAGNKSDGTTIRVTNKQRVASRGIEKTGLSEPQVIDVERKFRESDEGRQRVLAGKTINYSDLIYRKVRKRPLLILHLLQIDFREGGSHPDPVVAWGVSFPGSGIEEERVEYVVNTTWLRANMQEYLEDDEMGGDLED